MDPARRLSCELPQGRKAARVNGLWRVRGVPYLIAHGVDGERRMVSYGSFSSLGRTDLEAVHARHQQDYAELQSLNGDAARALLGRFGAVDAVVLPSHLELAAHVPAFDRVLPAGARLRDRYAAAVVTWATTRNALVPWLRGVPVRVGQARRACSLLFTERVVVRSELGDRSTHWTEILLDYARALGCDLASQTKSALFARTNTAIAGRRRRSAASCAATSTRRMACR